MTITSFRGPHAFLSNFYPSEVVGPGGFTYPTVEHAYQASKCNPDDDGAIREIWLAQTPAQAKRLGRKVNMRPHFDIHRLQIMRGLLESKFADPDLERALLATGEEDLIEGNTWGDTFWGACFNRKSGRWVGQNFLGILLMDLRTEFASEYDRPDDDSDLPWDGYSDWPHPLF